jgi:hypothetical protein
MTGEQIQAPSSPRDGEDVAITIGRPKVIFHSNISCHLLESLLFFWTMMKIKNLQ